MIPYSWLGGHNASTIGIIAVQRPPWSLLTLACNYYITFYKETLLKHIGKKVLWHLMTFTQVSWPFWMNTAKILGFWKWNLVTLMWIIIYSKVFWHLVSFKYEIEMLLHMGLRYYRKQSIMTFDDIYSWSSLEI